MRARTLMSLLAVLAFALPAGADVLINEIDCDTSGTDILEFLELFGDPNAPLDGMVLVLYNGSDDASYNDAFDLDGFTLDENGFFHIGNVDVVPTPDIIIPSNGIQNGPDAAALYYGDGVDFPNDTPLTLDNLIDAVVYGTSDPDDPELMTLLLAGPQVDENLNGNKDFESIFRCPDGAGGARVTTEFAVGVPTPGAANECGGGPVPTDYNLCDLRELDANGDPVHVGEYVHVIEPLIVLNDYGTVGAGRIDNAATDGTCCIYLFDYNQDLPLYEGDELDVIGTVDQYNGKLEIVALEITLLSSGNPLPTPELITTEELAVNGEDYESCLIQIDDLMISGGDPWPAEGDNANVEVVDETTVPTILRIDYDTDIDGTAPPAEPFICTGIGGQYDYAAPYFEGYQIQPRSLLDIEGYVPPPTQACCFDDGSCLELTPEDCEIAGGVVYDDEFCDPNPCPPTPADNSSWGEIKSMYR